MIVIFIITAFGCKKTVKVPDGLYDKSTMVNVLKELYVYEAQIQELKLYKQDTMRALFDNYEEKVFEKYSIDDSVYAESFNFYADNAQLLAEVYAMLTDSLSLEQRLLSEKEYKDYK